MLNIKFSLLIIILISYVHCRDKCIFCNQSVNACTICYFNCTDLIFNSCNDGQDNLNEITCL
jgi:histone acetyltransferase (RNA polymerase elongator complex component)